MLRARLETAVIVSGTNLNVAGQARRPYTQNKVISTEQDLDGPQTLSVWPTIGSFLPDSFPGAMTFLHSLQ
jgi:hypothetical protein